MALKLLLLGKQLDARDTNASVNIFVKGIVYERMFILTNSFQ